MNQVFLGLGSNIDKENNLLQAVTLLAEAAKLQAVSSVYETAPVGENSGDETFFNAAALVETPLDAAQLKEQVLIPIEEELGRVRTGIKNAPRSIDIDITLFNDEVFKLGRRRIPDPDLLTYAHVAIPMAEIAPDVVHPETGQTLAAIAAPFANNSGIEIRPDINLRRYSPKGEESSK